MNRKVINVLLAIMACIAIGLALVYGIRSHKEGRKRESRALYEKHCGNCHGPKGEGLKQLYPPLTDVAWLDVSTASCVIHYGLQGEIKVNGRKFSGTMPAQPEVRPDEIAAILEYIHREFLDSEKKVTIKEVNEALEGCRE